MMSSSMYYDSIKPDGSFSLPSWEGIKGRGNAAVCTEIICRHPDSLPAKERDYIGFFHSH